MYPSEQEVFLAQQQSNQQEVKKEEEIKIQFEQNFLPQQSQVQIIDCFAEITKKNYLPFILAVTEHQIENINGLDENGYNALHYAASQNSISMVKILVEQIGLDPNYLSKNLQTPLMLAINIGSTELISYFIQHMPKDQIDQQDSCGFTNLIYSVKASQIPTFLYLLNEGADINQKDNSGCNVAHWAAYQNHLDMLKLIDRLSQSKLLSTEDNQKCLPLVRAEENCSFKTAKYIKSVFNKNKDQGFYAKAPLLFTSIIYIILSITCYFQFHYYIKEKSNYFGTLFTILFIYFQMMLLYFIFKGKNNNFQSQQMKFGYQAQPNHETFDITVNQGFPDIDIILLKNTDFTKLNSALNFNQGYYNYIHYTIVYLDHLDFSRYCPQCLQYMPPQTHHKSQLDKCVEHYQHYSKFFGRIINNANHLLYYCLIGLQEILMILYIYCEIYSLRSQATSYHLVCYFETAYLAYTKIGIYNFLIYVLISYLLAMNSYYFILETYGICINQTRNEIFNRFKYRYLYKAVVNKRNTIWNYYTNPLSQGTSKNIQKYLAQAQEK